MISKKVDNVVSQKQETLGLINDKYLNCTKIYTDGSRDHEKVGAGIYANDHNIQINESIRISDNVAIASAELTAIKNALKLIEPGEIREWAILTDSLTSVQAINNYNKKSARPDLLQEIHESYTHLISLGHKITIVWIPSHCGIEGNEKADTLAKEATKQSEVRDQIKLGKTEINTLISKQITEKVWEDRWRKSNEGRTFYRYLEFVRKHNLLESRRNDKINRLRLGKPRFVVLQEKECKHCGAELTIEHAIVTCPSNDKIRTELREKYQMPDDYPLTVGLLLTPYEEPEEYQQKIDAIKYIEKVKQLI